MDGSENYNRTFVRFKNTAFREICQCKNAGQTSRVTILRLFVYNDELSSCCVLVLPCGIMSMNAESMQEGICMENRNPQKGKLLKLLGLLQKETDEKNPMSTAELCARLSESGINCDRRTLSKDIDLLNELDYEVMSTRKQHLKCYYIEDRSFSDAEIRILIDAVQAASFITEKKSEELIQKLCETGGCHRAKIQRENLVCFNTQKHTNESVYINVDTLERALQENRQASFLYFDLNENGERVYRREKERYVVDPMALIFENDNYYLMTYSKKHGEIANYRVDRMSAVDTKI